jgi:hypothetical protein
MRGQQDQFSNFKYTKTLGVSEQYVGVAVCFFHQEKPDIVDTALVCD